VLAWVNSPKFGGETGGNKGGNEAWEHIERAAANRAAGYVCMRVLAHVFMLCVCVCVCVCVRVRVRVCVCNLSEQGSRVASRMRHEPLLQLITDHRVLRARVHMPHAHLENKIK